MSSVPQLGMLNTTLTAQLDYIFGTFGEKMFIKESEIFDAYFSETRERLEDKLRLLNMSLNEFIKQRFYGRFNYIDDPENPAYMSINVYRSHISQQTQALPSTGQQQHNTGFAPTPPPAANGIGFSGAASFNTGAQPFRPSHTPTPPPVVPTGLHSSINPPPGLHANNANLVDHRAQMLNKQFSDRGFEPSDDGNVDQGIRKKTESPVVEMPESDEDDHFEEASTEPTGTSSVNKAAVDDELANNPVNYSPWVPQVPKASNGVAPPPGFGSFGSTSATRAHITELKNEENQQTTGGLLNENEFPALGDLKKDVEFVANQYSKTQQSSRTAPKTTKRPQEYTVPLFDNGFQVDLVKLFYKVFQSSIMNSPQVNIYRDTYCEHLASATGLYANVSDEFKWLTGTHLFANPNAEGYSPYNSFVIDVLQAYNKFYPNGMDAKVLIALENKLCSNGQRVCLGKSTEIMSVAELVSKKMIVVKGGCFFVHPEIAKIELWKLPAGLASNLYRLLNAQQETLIQDVSVYTGILTDMYNDPIMVSDEDIVRHANMFPLVFKICAEATEQNSARIGKISLHEKLPRWKVLLDQPSYFATPFHCDCRGCVSHTEYTPINVPHHD